MKRSTLVWLCSVAFVICTEVIFLFYAGPDVGNFNVKDYSYQTQESGYAVSIDTKTGVISLAPVGQTPVPQLKVTAAEKGLMDILPVILMAVLILGAVSGLAGMGQ